ncbi:endospore germination permease [Paenibacillus sp. GCM10027626]|uniref:GerAB/ArcD/ProY family transporter n=1 Tax=Paenibacillus sp. GCM10027626 TaxID=3273411 RepID=UPI00363B7660
MSNPVKISSRQLKILAALVTIGDSILVLPSVPAMEAKRDAWVSAIIGLAIGLLIVWLLVAVSKLSPKLSLVQLNEHVFGKWIGGVFSIAFLFYILLSLSAHLRELGDFNVSQIMPDTPIEAVHILLLLLVIFAVRQGLETFTRVAELLFPWIILFFLLIVCAMIPDADISKALPVFENGIKPSIRGSIACFSYPFMELVVFIMIFPHVNKTQHIRRDMLIGATIGGIILIATIALTVLILGADPAALFTYPGYDLAKRISIGKFIERIEAVLGLIWIVTTFFKLTIYYYSFSQGLNQLFRLQEYRMPLLSTGPLLIGMSIIVAPNLSFYSTYSAKYWPFLDMTFSVLLPLLLMLGFALRRRTKSSKDLFKPS